MANKDTLHDALSRLLSSYNDVEKRFGRQNEVVALFDNAIQQFCRDVNISPSSLNIG
jgi:hypothetical protein